MTIRVLPRGCLTSRQPPLGTPRPFVLSEVEALPFLTERIAEEGQDFDKLGPNGIWDGPSYA